MITISCDTIARLASLIPTDGESIIQTLRLDNGRAIATDRKFCAVESIAPFEGVFHVRLTAALVKQCEIERQFSSTVSIVPNAALKWTTARTSLGYDVTENIGVYPDEPTAFDRWYELIVKPCLTPATQSKGAMVCTVDEVTRLAATSPSGSLVFEQFIDVSRPTILRDINSPDWCGFFLPRLNDGIYYAPATVPSWLSQGAQ